MKIWSFLLKSLSVLLRMVVHPRSLEVIVASSLFITAHFQYSSSSFKVSFVTPTASHYLHCCIFTGTLLVSELRVTGAFLASLLTTSSYAFAPCNACFSPYILFSTQQQELFF